MYSFYPSLFLHLLDAFIEGTYQVFVGKKKQKEITKAIKRVQILGFIPVTHKDPAYLKDPKVCNIKYRE